LIEFLSQTGIVLTVIFILLSLIYLLLLFILVVRILEQVRNRRERNFIKRWEEKIFEYLADDVSPIQVVKLFPKSSYKYLLQNLRSYLLTLKGNDLVKLKQLINETELYDYLLGQLKSFRKKKIVFGAYYLGLAEAENAKFILRKKLKHRSEYVFLTSALSLARINDTDSLDLIFFRASKFKNLSKDTLQSILLEFDESVCRSLMIGLHIETSPVFKSIIIATLRHFKYSPAAPHVLPVLLQEETIDIVLEALKYFGQIEYMEAAAAIRFYLLNPRSEIKVEAIKAALKIGEATLEDRIWSLIYDKDRNVKVSAAEASYKYSEHSREKLKQLAYSIPNTIESSIARMIISEKTIHLN